MSAVDVVLLLSATVPPVAVIVLAWFFLRGKNDDPDEQRWQRLAEQRREAERESRAD